MARPREFDVDEAITIATRLFCERGYHATSISDLTDALGILRGSLYKVFPDKHSLLLTVLDRYRIAQLDDFGRKLANATTGLDGLRDVLMEWAEQSSGTNGRRGCLVTHLAQEMVPADPAVSERIHRHFQQLSELLEEVLERMKAEGTLTAAVPAPVVAQLLLSTLQGLRITGKLAPPASQTQEILNTLLNLLTEQSSIPASRTAAAAAGL